MGVRTILCTVILLIAAAATAAACGDSGGGARTTPGSASPTAARAGNPSSGSGSLIITDSSGLMEYDLKSGKRRPLITPDLENTFLLDPAVSPDGKHLVYVVQPPPTIVNRCEPGAPTPTVVAEGSPGAACGTYDAGSDVWVANRDGSDAHRVFAHEQPNQLMRFPQWADDATILMVVQEFTERDGVTNIQYVLERMPAAGGERTKVISDALAFGISPDRRQLVYVRYPADSGEELKVADVSGANERTLVGIGENLSPFNVPRYSPDGTKVAFASADQTGARAGSLEFVSSSAAGPAVAPRANGLPEDIWTVDIAGGRPVRVADLKEDLPALTWGGDGKHIYVLGAAGLYDVNIESGAVDRLGEGAFHGMLEWVP